MITITHIDYADPDCSTDIVHVVTLSDGRILSIWSGQAAYDVYDDCTGNLVVGAKLTGITKKEDHNIYHFS